MANSLNEISSCHVLHALLVSCGECNRNLQSQLALHEESATASRRELEERVSSIQSTCEGLRLEAREAQDAQKMATELAASQLQRCQQVQEELNDARQTAKLLAQEKGEELSRPGTLEAKLENVTDKYDTLKRRYVEAGRKASTAVIAVVSC